MSSPSMEAPYQEALDQVNDMLQGFAQTPGAHAARTPGTADAFPTTTLESPPRPPSAVANARAPATAEPARRRPPAPPLYAWESRAAPGTPRVEQIETHAGVFAATATPGLYAAHDPDDGARAYVDVQVVLTRSEADEVRALQRRAVKAAVMHSSQPHEDRRPVAYRSGAKAGSPRWNT